MAKLSEIKGERSFDVVAEIVEPVMNIAEDVDAAELFGRKALPNGTSVKEFVIGRIKRAMPVLLKNHKADIIKICAAIEGISEAEYAEAVTPEKVIVDMSELISDAVFNAFFN